MINYIKGNLFDASMDSLLVHSISSDARMGAGIAKAFAKIYPEDVSQMRYSYEYGKKGLNGVGEIYTSINKDKHSVAHMFAKKIARIKPENHDGLYECLEKVFNFAKNNDFDTISMPLIGSGLDAIKGRGINGADWKEISEQIILLMNKYNINVDVYVL